MLRRRFAPIQSGDKSRALHTQAPRKIFAKCSDFKVGTAEAQKGKADDVGGRTQLLWRCFPMAVARDGPIIETPGNGATFDFDELRIGTTFAAVAPSAD
jgi:hypothetical protein